MKLQKKMKKFAKILSASLVITSFLPNCLRTSDTGKFIC